MEIEYNKGQLVELRHIKPGDVFQHPEIIQLMLRVMYTDRYTAVDLVTGELREFPLSRLVYRRPGKFVCT